MSSILQDAAVPTPPHPRHSGHTRLEPLTPAAPIQLPPAPPWPLRPPLPEPGGHLGLLHGTASSSLTTAALPPAPDPPCPPFSSTGLPRGAAAVPRPKEGCSSRTPRTWPLLLPCHMRLVPMFVDVETEAQRGPVIVRGAGQKLSPTLMSSQDTGVRQWRGGLGGQRRARREGPVGHR